MPSMTASPRISMASEVDSAATSDPVPNSAVPSRGSDGARTCRRAGPPITSMLANTRA